MLLLSCKCVMLSVNPKVITIVCVSRQILLNEVAPRPHNSGHHTIESCYTSQYEQHLRAVVGLPLGNPSMKTPAAIMYNILGEEEVLLAYKFYPISFSLRVSIVRLAEVSFSPILVGH